MTCAGMMHVQNLIFFYINILDTGRAECRDDRYVCLMCFIFTIWKEMKQSIHICRH